MSDEEKTLIVPMPQGPACNSGPYLVVRGSKVEAVFETEAEAEAWSGHLSAVYRSYGGEYQPIKIQVLPKMSKLTLQIGPAEPPEKDTA